MFISKYELDPNSPSEALIGWAQCKSRGMPEHADQALHVLLTCSTCNWLSQHKDFVTGERAQHLFVQRSEFQIDQ
jgi:hypothetical protein